MSWPPGEVSTRTRLCRIDHLKKIIGNEQYEVLGQVLFEVHDPAFGGASMKRSDKRQCIRFFGSKIVLVGKSPVTDA
jgi:hypothetical protein